MQTWDFRSVNVFGARHVYAVWSHMPYCASKSTHEALQDRKELMLPPTSTYGPGSRCICLSSSGKESGVKDTFPNITKWCPPYHPQGSLSLHVF